MSLYKEHRPDTLDKMHGNSEIINTLESLLSDANKIPSAFMFYGPSGTGKTTIARIIKNMLDVSDNDFREINSSNDRGIDAIREIIKTTYYKPLNGDFKIYLLDEAHKLTNDAQNALLKILEDTPKHVIFILATTEQNKLITAIHRRCQKFQLSLLSENQMKRLIMRTAKKEGEKLETEVIEQIIITADGYPGNALQILEQVINTDEDGRLKAAQQSAFEQSESIELCRVLISGAKWDKIKKILAGLVGQDAERIRRHVLAYAQSVLLKGSNDRAGLILEVFNDPFYNSGFPALVSACYITFKN